MYETKSFLPDISLETVTSLSLSRPMIEGFVSFMQFDSTLPVILHVA